MADLQDASPSLDGCAVSFSRTNLVLKVPAGERGQFKGQFTGNQLLLFVVSNTDFREYSGYTGVGDASELGATTQMMTRSRQNFFTVRLDDARSIVFRKVDGCS